MLFYYCCYVVNLVLPLCCFIIFAFISWLGSVKVEPQEQLKKVNDEATFVCKTYNPVKWTYNRGRLPDTAKISGKSGEQLTIYIVSTSVVGSYECVMQDRGILYTSFGILDVVGELCIIIFEVGNHTACLIN